MQAFTSGLGTELERGAGVDASFSSELLELNPVGPVSLYWTDHGEACEHYRQRLRTDPTFARQLQKLEERLGELTETHLWLRRGEDIQHASLYQLYEALVLERSFGPRVPASQELLDVSFVSPSGPYRRMALADCFNLETYQDFILVALLRERLPERDFRLRLSSRLLLEHGPALDAAVTIDLEQITTTGLLLRMPRALYEQHLRPLARLRLLLNSEALVLPAPTWHEFRRCVGAWGAHPLFTQHKSHHISFAAEALAVSSRFDVAVTKQVYLFLPFAAFATSAPEAHERLVTFARCAREGASALLRPERRSA